MGWAIDDPVAKGTVTKIDKTAKNIAGFTSLTLNREVVVIFLQ
jgi:hypothetical protein